MSEESRKAFEEYISSRKEMLDHGEYSVAEEFWRAAIESMQPEIDSLKNELETERLR